MMTKTMRSNSVRSIFFPTLLKFLIFLAETKQLNHETSNIENRETEMVSFSKRMRENLEFFIAKFSTADIGS